MVLAGREIKHKIKAYILLVIQELHATICIMVSRRSSFKMEFRAFSAVLKRTVGIRADSKH